MFLSHKHSSTWLEIDLKADVSNKIRFLTLLKHYGLARLIIVVRVLNSSPALPANPMQIQPPGVHANPVQARFLRVELVAELLEVYVRNLPAPVADEVVVLFEVGVVPRRRAAELEMRKKSRLDHLLHVPVDGRRREHRVFDARLLIYIVNGQVLVGVRQNTEYSHPLRRQLKPLFPGLVYQHFESVGPFRMRPSHKVIVYQRPQGL